MFDVTECDRLVDALEMKIKSLQRGQRSASPGFKVVFDAEISYYEDLRNKVRSLGNENAAKDGKKEVKA